MIQKLSLFTPFIVFLSIQFITQLQYLKFTSAFIVTRTNKHYKSILMPTESIISSSSLQLHPKNAKGIIFDIDGTLANSWKLGFDATQVVLSNNNIPLITEELYHECTRYCTPDRLARHAGLLPPEEEEKLTNDSIGNKNESDFSKVGNRLAKEFDELYVGLVSTETAGFYEGVYDMIVSLKNDDGTKVAALTNACVAYAHAVLKVNCPLENRNLLSSSIQNQQSKSFGIYNRFEAIHGADTVSKPKPNPDGLFQCCNEIGIPPELCVYIGDSPSDAIAAKRAGMIAIGVLWGSHSKNSLSKAPFDYYCESITELKELLPCVA